MYAILIEVVVYYSNWNEAVWSYPKLNEDVPLGPKMNGLFCLPRVDLVYWNSPKFFNFMETFLTSPKFEWSCPNCSNFIKIAKIYPNDFDFIQIWINLL